MHNNEKWLQGQHKDAKFDDLHPKKRKKKRREREKERKRY
jgi:hypothetical protein